MIIGITTMTDQKIQSMLDFGDRLKRELEAVGKDPALPAHLEAQYQELLREQERRKTGVDGEGI